MCCVAVEVPKSREDNKLLMVDGWGEEQQKVFCGDAYVINQLPVGELHIRDLGK
jgi:hypothetical protein